MVRSVHPKALQYPGNIELARGLHQTSQHHLLEHLIAHGREPEAGIRRPQYLPQHVTTRAHNPHPTPAGRGRGYGRSRFSRRSPRRGKRQLLLPFPGGRCDRVRGRLQIQIQSLLSALDDLPASLDQQGDLYRSMR